MVKVTRDVISWNKLHISFVDTAITDNEYGSEDRALRNTANHILPVGTLTP